MLDPDVLEKLLAERGTRSGGADSSILNELVLANPKIPDDILKLLQIQNGEDTLRTFNLKYSLMSAEEILESIQWHREMVVEEELFAPIFVSFVPFLRSELKTTVGVFTDSEIIRPGEVVEYCYETGELVKWASSPGEFIAGLGSREGAFFLFGDEFPADGVPVVQDTDLR